MSYITADIHFGHNNIIQYCNRPTTIEEHDEWLIKQLNSVVQKSDTIYNLGDFTFYENVEKIHELSSRLHGKWLHVLGNHDDEKILRKAFDGTNHKILGSYHELQINKRLIVMSHYPFESWNKMKYKSIHFFGHLHQHSNMKHMRVIENRHLVSLDSHPNFKPYKIEDFIK